MLTHHVYVFCRYLDDFYELELQAQSGVKGWNIPETKGGGPSARESHSSVVYTGKGGNSPKLYVFGGMCGHRLNDLWQLDLGNSLSSSCTVSACKIVIWHRCCFSHKLMFFSVCFRNYDLGITSDQRGTPITQKSAHLQCDWKQVMTLFLLTLIYCHRLA